MRLKAFNAEFIQSQPIEFQFNACVIKGVAVAVGSNRRRDFNSTLVRLKVLHWLHESHCVQFQFNAYAIKGFYADFILSQPIEFQFNAYAIKGVYTSGHFWFLILFQFNACAIKGVIVLVFEWKTEDFNSTLVRLKDHIPHVRIVRLRFQFNACAIKGRWIDIVGQLPKGFNSTLVRLKAYKTCPPNR